MPQKLGERGRRTFFFLTQVTTWQTKEGRVSPALIHPYLFSGWCSWARPGLFLSSAAASMGRANSVQLDPHHPVTTGARGIYTDWRECRASGSDRSCDWTTDSDMVLESCPGSDVNMVLFGRSHRSAWTRWQHNPETHTWLQVWTPILGICTTSDGNRNLRHRHKSYKQQGHRPRHGPRHSSGPPWPQVSAHVRGTRLFPCIVWAHFRTFLDSNFWLFSTRFSSSSLSINYSRPASFYLSLYPSFRLPGNGNHFVVSYFHLLPSSSRAISCLPILSFFFFPMSLTDRFRFCLFSDRFYSFFKTWFNSFIMISFLVLLVNTMKCIVE